MHDDFSAEETRVDSILTRNKEEFGEGIKDITFAKNIVSNAISRRITIDDIITRAAPDWPLVKIGTIDRNILRLGLTELLFGDRSQVPPKVAIDEAIELAKMYGGETSGRFVNGVLGAIYKEMGEPGKDQTTKTKEEQVDRSKKEHLAGGVVCTRHGHDIQIALVHDVFGYWTLPKGHIQKDEDVTVGLVRELKKEIGVDVKITALIPQVFSDVRKGWQGIFITYLCEMSNPNDQITINQEASEYNWFTINQIPHLTRLSGTYMVAELAEKL
jgi:N utilization substance protein B